MFETQYKFFKQYLLNEVNNIVSTLSVSLSEEYTWFIDLEQKQYKQSAQYKRLMNAYERSQGQYYGLQESLKRLNTWEATNGRSSNDPHISHCGRTNEWNEREQLPIGFHPSISRSEYILRRTNELLVTNVNPIAYTVLKHVQSKWSNEPIADVENSTFEQFCINHCADSFFVLKDYIVDLLNIIQKHKVYYVPQQPCHIVTNGCKINVTINENNKTTSFDINITNHPAQTVILGKMIGDTFTLPNIPWTYCIQKIYHSN